VIARKCLAHTAGVGKLKKKQNPKSSKNFQTIPKSSQKINKAQIHKE
jgi:hypothetical protein